MRWVALAVMAITGCNDECLGGVCANLSYDKGPRPGPCRSADDHGGTTTFHYDLGKLVHGITDYAASGPATDESTYFYEAFWTWDGFGSPTAVRVIDTDNAARSEVEHDWAFGSQITVTVKPMSTPVAIYDPALAGSVWSRGEIEPSPAIGELLADGVTYTWTSSPGQLVRTGSDGTVWTYVLDDNARVLSISSDGTPFATFNYDTTGRLASKTVNAFTTTYRYDRGGNLAETFVDGARTVAYDYSCW